MTLPPIESLVADNGQPAIPLHAVTAADWPRFAETKSAELRAWAKAQDFRGQNARVLLIPGPDGAPAEALLGLGANDDKLIYGAAAEKLPAGDYRLVPSGAVSAENAALGFALSSYGYNAFKPLKANAPHPRLVVADNGALTSARRKAQGVCLARDLVSAPSNLMGPEELAGVVEEIGERHGASVRITEGDALLEANYPMIHTVGRASVRAPRLIDLAWGDEAAPRVTLVGKGVCFDSGGLDLKSAAGMALMKKDMGGAAAMLGLAHMIMDARLAVRLRLLIPAVENAVAGNAYRPGDVLISRKGLAVEIGNTDAEGRLVLADALADADEETPALLVCMATLTGAARIATGFELPPVFTHDDALANDLLALAVSEQDPMVRLPLWKNYEALIDGKVADITNSADSPNAGCITAALFLNRFVTRTKSFVHFDVAAWTDRARPGKPVGAEAHAIRALYTYLANRFGTKTA